ncbi:MAG: hypothetical protein LBO74_17935 [Candidatus Symbiothrix sp.]|jgi:hypothetical protein|nr:hypothetical protein [Candidatus Symbiothrix sp.]
MTLIERIGADFLQWAGLSFIGDVAHDAPTLIDKVIELYEKLISEKDERIISLEKMLKERL